MVGPRKAREFGMIEDLDFALASRTDLMLQSREPCLELRMGKLSASATELCCLDRGGLVRGILAPSSQALFISSSKRTRRAGLLVKMLVLCYEYIFITS